MQAVEIHRMFDANGHLLLSAPCHEDIGHIRVPPPRPEHPRHSKCRADSGR
jgi:hypothetical protein